MPTLRARWDVFCRVVDNYGDAGVCWRLARQLAREHRLQVTLFIDDIAVLSPMAAGIRDGDTQHGVTVRGWPAAPPIGAIPALPPVADVVIEGFGGGLPGPYLAAMARCPRPPRWFVLEYLSAEAWVESTHDHPSPHPQLGLPRRFWFPGFSAATGGLLREADLAIERDRFQRDPIAQRSVWSALGVPPRTGNELRVSVFCYPNPALPALLDACAAGGERVTCIIAGGTAPDAAGVLRCRPGRRPLEVHRIAFVDQDSYDRVLWACDVNFVRGEDSFVRAQWAARPLVWQAYPQPGDAHRTKLDAFVDRYTVGSPATTALALRALHDAWNGIPGAPPMIDAWRAFTTERSAVARHAVGWARDLARLPDLASGLVKASIREV